MASVYSNGSNDEENICTKDETQVVTTSEKYEEKLLQSIENATEKSTHIRIQAIQTIAEILQHRHIPDFLGDRKFTMMDIVEKSLRRGKGAEQELAAHLSILLIIQLGGEDDVFSTLNQVLSTALQNRNYSHSVRAWLCTALSLFHFLNSEDITSITEVMQQFEQIFAGSYVKGDKTLPAVGEDISQLHVAALGAWGLLATLIPPAEFCLFINNRKILR